MFHSFLLTFSHLSNRTLQYSWFAGYVKLMVATFYHSHLNRWFVAISRYNKWPTIAFLRRHYQNRSWTMWHKNFKKKLYFFLIRQNGFAWLNSHLCGVCISIFTVFGIENCYIFFAFIIFPDTQIAKYAYVFVGIVFWLSIGMKNIHKKIIHYISICSLPSFTLVLLYVWVNVRFIPRIFVLFIFLFS